MDKGRRAILARLVDLPLTVAGIGVLAQNSVAGLFSIDKIDVSEYSEVLSSYAATWSTGTTYRVSKDIRRRVAALERNVIYSVENRVQIVDLLCGYQVLAADVIAEQDPEQAAQFLGKTVVLSKEEGLQNFYVHALRQRAQTYISRFEVTRDQNVLKQALEDFQQTDIVHGVSPFYMGLVNVRKGLALAYSAKDKSSFTVALNLIDTVETQIGKIPEDNRVAARIDLERWRLNRASAYLYSPWGSPAIALQELEELEREQPNTSPRRAVHRNLLFSETYLALNNFPMSVAYASTALETTTRSYMDTLSNRLENVYRALRSSPYGGQAATAQFGVDLLKAQRPELFS